MTKDTLISSGAEFSQDRKYRYTLWRQWEEVENWVAFIGLNPSIADETEDDPTVRRCINFAKKWGYSGMFMLNIFAYRATDPKEMKAAEDPIGIANNRYINITIYDSDRVVLCWGNHGSHIHRNAAVAELVSYHSNVVHFGLTKSREPKHPLYLSNNAQLYIWGDNNAT
jgi:hypothetical protein